MSTASVGIRASKKRGIPNPPGVPPQYIPLPIGNRGIEFEVIQSGQNVVAEVVPAPWNQGGGLLFRRVNMMPGSNFTEIRSTVDSIPLVMSTFTAGTSIAVYVEDLEGSNPNNTYTISPAEISVITNGLISRGSVTFAPSGILTGPQPGARTFFFTSTGNDVSFFRWYGQLAGALSSMTTRARLSYIGYWR